ncbi:hypothetical protein PGTUg99_013272 [Puccinia graminis f. sp. tritici]|uniref:Uncharacterized protein n=1 Tax=Puccinia graminis f. sp. tritici TaxID=56615 RepID=A0A5B0S9A5_PUCGR|nr:hypothetical protein PGTUg99_013272 [Puccinia graminis f. sp. tritici]
MDIPISIQYSEFSEVVQLTIKAGVTVQWENTTPNFNLINTPLQSSSMLQPASLKRQRPSPSPPHHNSNNNNNSLHQHYHHQENPSDQNQERALIRNLRALEAELCDLNRLALQSETRCDQLQGGRLIRLNSNIISNQLDNSVWVDR